MSSVSSPVALVTAGSAGLGAATARLLARSGYRVLVNYSANTARAQALVDELNAAAPTPAVAAPHATLQADLGVRADVERLAAAAVAAAAAGGHDGLDLVFSNGGWTAFRDTTRLADNVFDDDWDRAYTMNVKSHVWLLKATEAALAAREGAFITTASMAGVTGMGSALAYAASKAAQIHMVRGLASMVAPHVRVNSVSPSLLETEWAERFSPEQKAATRARTKLGRFVTVEDVADQVLGLARNKSMTGVNVIMDAGFSL